MYNNSPCLHATKHFNFQVLTYAAPALTHKLISASTKRCLIGADELAVISERICGVNDLVREIVCDDHQCNR